MFTRSEEECSRGPLCVTKGSKLVLGRPFFFVVTASARSATYVLFRVLPMQERHFFVYTMMSSSRRALYTGVTNNLRRRVSEHKSGEYGRFSAKYNADRLVWFERYEDIRNAIRHPKCNHP